MLANMTMNYGPGRSRTWMDDVFESDCCAWFYLAFIVVFVISIVIYERRRK
jgi:cytochrome c biogenesis protein ResB